VASIRPRSRRDGTPYWSVLYNLDGRQSSTSFNDQADAEYLRDLINRVGAARALELANLERRQRSAMTVEQFLRRYINHLTGLERGTITRYLSYIERDIGPHLGAIPLTELSRDDVAAWVNRMQATGSSGKTVKNKRDFLASALHAAVKNNEILTNPCDGVRPQRWDRLEMVFLTREEFRTLNDAVATYWRPMVEFLVASGCRWSEATALRPDDVDRLANTVRISRAWKKGNELGVPKTRKSRRTINLPGRVLDQLDYTGEWLFTNSGVGNRNRGGPVRLPNFTGNVWRPALARAELDKTPRIHDLRHTCASWLIQSGVPLPVVQSHLGHESIETTVGVYGHLDRRSAEQAAAVIGKMLA
jgi:integrase